MTRGVRSRAGAACSSQRVSELPRPRLQVSPPAALLFAPTLVWVTIAAKLNYDIVRLNADGKSK